MDKNILAILMSTHNVCFYGELTKIILQLSSNTHLIFPLTCLSVCQNIKNHYGNVITWLGWSSTILIQFSSVGQMLFHNWNRYNNMYIS